MADRELRERFGRLELEFQQLRGLLETEIQRRGAAGMTEEVKTLREQVAALTLEKQQLQQALDQIKAERVKPTPSQLVQSFRVAMDELRTSLQPKPGDRVGYTVSQFDVDLKAMVTVDKEGQAVKMVLPEPGETVPEHLLSSVRFVFRTVPKPEVVDQELVEVPNLLGLSQDAAVKALERVNLKLGERAEQASAYPPGTVIGQSPDGGDQVPTGSAVNVVVARRAQVEVPVLVNLKLADAQALIEASNLTVGTVTEEPSAVPPGTVIGQTPEAETLVNVGTSVDLTVAKEGKVVVPDVVGRKEEEAQATLNSANLTLGERTTRPTTAEGVGAVLEQDPKAGSQVAPKTPVNLVIGVADLVTVPNLINLSREQATVTLQKARLALGTVTTRKHRLLDGVVIGQDPQPGREVPAHTSVNIVVAQKLVVRDVLAELQKQPGIQRLGISLRVLGEQLEKARIDTVDKLLELTSRPDTQFSLDLGLPKKANARDVKRMLRESGERIVSERD